MDNLIQFLQKLQGAQPNAPQLSPIDAFYGPPPSAGEGDMLQDDGFYTPANISQHVQEVLGAKQPDDGGLIGNILASRSRPTQDDSSDALLKTMFSKSYTSPQDVAASRDLGVAKQLYAVANINKLASGQNLPAAVQIANEFAKARAANDTQRMEDLKIAAKSYDKGIITDVNGGVTTIAGYAGAVGDINRGKETGKETGKLDVERQAGFTKAQSALRGFEQQANLVTNTTDKALALINNSNTATGYGRAASFGGALPNSDARALDNYLTTIKANLGFDKLQNMRENSPTGGALGQISDFENRLLQAVNGALDPLQEDQLKENLQIIKTLYPQVLQERRRAFAQDYGGYEPLGGNTQPPPQTPTNTPIPQFSSPSDPEFIKLPSGAAFIDSEGIQRVKH